MLARLWSNRTLIAGENTQWYGHFEKQFGNSLFKKLNILIPYNPAMDCLLFPEWIENLYLHKNLYTDVYNRFIHNCQKLEATKMTFSRQMNKLQYTQTVEYYSAIKINELSSHEKSGGSLNTCWWVKEVSLWRLHTDFNYDTVERQNDGDSERIRGCQELGGRKND